MPPSHVLIACDVFRDEIEHLIDHDSLSFAAVHWHEMGLHDRPDALRKTLQGTIDDCAKDSATDAIVLAYGLCGNGLLGIRAPENTPLIVPQAQDCISVFLGSSERHRELLKKQPETYFYSPGWIREKRVPGPDREGHLRDLFTKKYPDDEELVDDLVEADRATYEAYQHAGYVSLTDHPASRQYCRDCARFLGWEFQHLRGDDSFLKALLRGDTRDERILTIPPGQALSLSPEGQLRAVTPAAQ